MWEFSDKELTSAVGARDAASSERSLGLGVIGFHSFLQANGIPLEGVMAKVWNRKIFAQIRKDADAASKTLAEERGPCPDAEEFGIMERFSHKMAIAQTAPIPIICGEVGRSSCRALVCRVVLIPGGAGEYKKKKKKLS